MTPEEIIERLKRSDAQSERLLDECRSPDMAMWHSHPELYLAFVERLIQQGHPGRALDLAREGEQYLRNDPRLQYQLALAAARGGNPKYAEDLLQRLLEKAIGNDTASLETLSTALRVDVISLKGRVLKDRSLREPHLASESAAWYERAAAVPGAHELSHAGTFPLINAATMWRIAGKHARSEELAAEVVRRLESRAETTASSGNMWPAATLGEAFLLLGNHEESYKWYVRAVETANSRGEVGNLVSLRNNLHRLQRVGATADHAFVDEHLGRVVVFSGHLLDSPERIAAGYAVRFPNQPALVEAVSNAMGSMLDTLNAKIGYCSLGCGGDILFAEEMLKRNAELHVVLPFAQHDFRRTSVDFGQDGAAWRSWRQRFDRVLDKVEQASPTRVTYATREPYLGSQELFKFSNVTLQGLAVLRARERVSEPTALALVDHTIPGQSGGTVEFLSDWRKAGYSALEIDLAALRADHCGIGKTSDNPAAPVTTSALRRPVKSMLFADVAGYSGINEWELPAFLTAYGSYLRELFASPIGREAAYANTWGDGLFVVFNRTGDAAEFAAELIEPSIIRQPDWKSFGLGATTPFRVGLHSGPVFELTDLFQGRSEFAGQHVNRAARIEPVTLRGCAYASEPFAAHLMMACRERFAIEAVGVHSLAKEYDRCHLYRVSR